LGQVDAAGHFLNAFKVEANKVVIRF